MTYHNHDMEDYIDYHDIHCTSLVYSRTLPDILYRHAVHMRVSYKYTTT